MADLYVYFYELGPAVFLKPGGLLSFIVTNKWMKSGYGEPLRRLFFGRKRGSNRWSTSATRNRSSRTADVFPSIIVARKPTESAPAEDGPASARFRANNCGSTTPQPPDRRGRR